MKWRNNATEGDKWVDPTRLEENGAEIVIEVNLLRFPGVEAMEEVIPMETEDTLSMAGVGTNTRAEIMAVEVDTADIVVVAETGVGDRMRDEATGEVLVLARF